jgi:hypothetical protein
MSITRAFSEAYDSSDSSTESYDSSSSYDDTLIEPDTPIISQLPAEPPALSRRGMSTFDCVVWWDSCARVPSNFLTQAQLNVIQNCDYLSNIRRYAISTAFRDFYNPNMLHRSFGHSCESGCACESQPIDVEHLQYRVLQSEQQDIFEEYNYFNANGMEVYDDDGNLFEPFDEDEDVEQM